MKKAVNDKQQDWMKRGFVEPTLSSLSRDVDTLCIALQAKDPCTRTLAARDLLPYLDEERVQDALLGAFQIEKALYTKLEIAQTLQQGNLRCCQKIVNALASRENKQYQTLPLRVSKKQSYPLARDLHARILAKMNSEFMPFLLDRLCEVSLLQQRELLDAIGFMAFYNKIDRANIMIRMQTYYDTVEDPICKWKVIQVCSALKPDSIAFLQSIEPIQPLIKKEAERSLSL